MGVRPTSMAAGYESRTAINDLFDEDLASAAAFWAANDVDYLKYDNW